MLFEVHQSVIDYISTNEESKSSKIFIALDNLAKAIREGKHLLFSDISVLQYLSELDNIERNSKEIYNRYYHKYSSLVYIRFISLRIVLVKNYEMNTSENNDNSIIYLDIEKLYCSDYLNKTILLTENLTDTGFYANITRKYLSHIKSNGIILSLKPDAGGGSQTANKFNSINEINEDLCLCICDSDTKYPDYGFGDTYKDVSRVTINSICESFVLKVREAENLIPSCIYELEKNYRGKAISNIKNIGYYSHIDVKQGLTNMKLSDGKKYTFWRDYLVSNSFIERDKLDAILNIDAEVSIIEGMGSNFLKNVSYMISENGLINTEKNISSKIELRKINKDIPEEAIKELEYKLDILMDPFNYLPKDFYNYWKEIAQKVLNWCCGSEFMNV